MTDSQIIKESCQYEKHDRYWIPADEKNMGDFYINHILIPHSRVELLKSVASRTFGFLNWKYFILSHSGSIKNGQNRPFLGSLDDISSGNKLSKQKPYSLTDIKQIIEEKFTECEFDFKSPVNFIVLEDYHDSERSQSLLFVFERDSAFPIAIAKIVSGSGYRENLEHEFNALHHMNKRIDIGVKNMVPIPLILFDHQRYSVSVQSFIRGSSIYFDLRNHLFPGRRASGHFGLALRWLVEFQKATISDGVLLNDEAIERYIVRPFMLLQHRFELTEIEMGVITNTVRDARKLIGRRIPLVASQGDFWPRNIIVDNDKVGVVDWEGFDKKSLPFTDLYMFSTSYGLNYPWVLGKWFPPDKAFLYTYFNKSYLSAVIKEYFDRYCVAMDISSDLLKIFFPVFLAEKACREGLNSNNNVLWKDLFYEYSQQRYSVCHIL